MGRIRALGYGVSVSAAVFLYLGLPMLRRLYGPEVTLLAYAGIALIAGGVTYSVVVRFSPGPDQTRDAAHGDATPTELRTEGEPDGDDQREYSLVEQELEQLQEEE